MDEVTADSINDLLRRVDELERKVDALSRRDPTRRVVFGPVTVVGDDVTEVVGGPV